MATLAAYQPAWHGGLVWDDQRHITAPELRSLEGLGRVWSELGATQQYYPLLHTAFWIQHRLWGDATLGYHLVNIVLHALAACLVLVLLRRLRVPGAVLAAVVFALHPVHVESVAWITELKNTLSGVLVLGAALAYLRFDRERAWRSYVLSLALFCCSLLSKSVTATLPGALLVVFWWERGRITWRRDVAPLAPFIVVGAVSGLFTAWVERTYIGAEGSDFPFTFVERGLIAGRAVWFYLGKLVWPSNLNFVYPRWSISQADPWQYLYPLTMVALLGALWVVRRRSRAPLAALLMFGGLLFPVMGFVNVYPFRFSFVADHFQYLASIPMIALASAGATSALQRCGPRFAGGVVAALVVGTTMGTLSWHQSHDYADALTLYRATIARNPDAWMAHGNLGALIRRTDPEQAVDHLTAAVRIKPELVEGHYNLGAALLELGRVQEAEAQFRQAIQLSPGHARAHTSLANTLQRQGLGDDAEREYRQAIRFDPDLAIAHSGLGRQLQSIGRFEEALQSCETAVRLQPNLAAAHRDLAGVLVDLGRLDDAVSHYATALRIRADDAELHNDLGAALQQSGRFEEAAGHYRAALQLDARLAPSHVGLAATLRALGQLDEARQACESGVQLAPELTLGQFELGNILMRQGLVAEAIERYRKAAALQPDAPEVHCALAMALDGAGRRDEAGAHMTEALRLAPDEVAAHAAMGTALEGQGRLQAARVEFAEAVQLAPSYLHARIAIARIDAQLHRSGAGPWARRRVEGLDSVQK